MALIRLYMLVKWVTRNLFHRNKITRTCYVNKDTYHNVSVVAKGEKKKQGKKEKVRRGGGKKKEKKKLIKKGRKYGKKG